MDSGRPPSKDPRPARTRAAVLAAAHALFDDRGVERTTIDDVSERAQISVGSIYAHFGSKDGLVFSVVDGRLEAGLADLDRVRERAESPLARVLATGHAYLAFARHDPVAFRFVAQRALDPDPRLVEDEVGERIAGRVRTVVERVEADLEQAIADGEIPPMETRQALVFLVGAWNGVAGQLLQQDDPIPFELAEQSLALGQSVLLRGLGVEPARFSRA